MLIFVGIKLALLRRGVAPAGCALSARANQQIARGWQASETPATLRMKIGRNAQPAERLMRIVLATVLKELST
jgi:hypothetical protein